MQQVRGLANSEFREIIIEDLYDADQGILCMLMGFAAVRLYAQTQLPSATMTIQVQVPSNTPAGDTIWVFGGQFFNIFTPRVPMSRVPGTSNTWQATISAPAGTIFRYYFARNNDYSKLETYAPFWPNGSPR